MRIAAAIIWMMSITKINGDDALLIIEQGDRNYCTDVPDGYTTGEDNPAMCGDYGSTGQGWCGATQQCVRGQTCPFCYIGSAENLCTGPDNTQLCCDYWCDVTANCTDAWEMNAFGTTDKRCLLGELWCESFEQCVDEMAICPVCPVHAPYWCGPPTGVKSFGNEFADFMNNGKCCNYNDKCMSVPDLKVASVESGCELESYSSEKCDCGDFCSSYSREYFAKCPKCNDTILRTGEFGAEVCSLNDYWPKDMDKTYDLLVLPCALGEFAFLDGAVSIGVRFVMAAIGIFYAVVY